MSRLKKILSGIATAWPIAYMVLFMLFIFFMILLAPGGGDGFAALILLIFPVHILTIFLIISLQIYYILDVFKNERVGKDQKVIWVIALFLGSMMAMPIYWYMNIWREVDGRTGHSALGSGENFEPAQSWESKKEEPVQREPHIWR